MTTIHWKSFAILSRPLALSISLFLFSVLGFLFAQAPQEVDEPKTRESYHAAQVRYAQSYLDLTKHELKVAEQIKQSISAHSLEQKRSDVKVAEEQLRVVSSPVGETETTPIRLRFAEEDAKHARNDYMKAVAAQKGNKAAFTDSQVETFRLKAEVAKHRLNVMSNPAHMMSLLDHMHWEINRLSEDLLALQSQVEELKEK
jgi:hypothetical protein